MIGVDRPELRCSKVIIRPVVKKIISRSRLRDLHVRVDGKAKGVMLEHRSLVNYMTACGVLRDEAGDRVLQRGSSI